MAVSVHEPQQPLFSRQNRASVARFFGYAAMILLVVAIGAPLYWMITASVKTNAEVFTFPPQWIPTDPHWSNYREAWNVAPFGRV